MVDAKTSILLQTATAVVSDNIEKRSVPVKILLGSGSQRTYLSERIVKHLNLKLINTQVMTIKTFGNDDEKAIEMNEYSFCVKSLNNGCNVYMRGFAMPLICSPLSGQRLDVVSTQFPILKGLDLADKGSGESEIDMLIGADLYWHVLDGKMIRCGSGRLIALKSKLGWLLSGPFDS